MTGLILFIGLCVVVAAAGSLLAVFLLPTGGGELAAAPGPTAEDDGPVPDCDCEDCEYEREFAAIVERTWTDA